MTEKLLMETSLTESKIINSDTPVKHPNTHKKLIKSLSLPTEPPKSIGKHIQSRINMIDDKRRYSETIESQRKNYSLKQIKRSITHNFNLSIVNKNKEKFELSHSFNEKEEKTPSISEKTT